MAEILGQKAIDQLVEQTTVSEPTGAATPEVRSHSFLRSAHQPKDHAPLLETLAKALKRMLSIQLRAPVEVTATGAEEILFSEFALSLGSPCAAYSFPVDGEEGKQGVLDWGTDAALAFVDRLLGGVGESTGLGRGMTRLEQELVRGLTEQTLILIQGALKEHVEITPKTIGFESNPGNLKTAGAEDRILAAIFEVRSEGFQGISTLGLPAEAMKSVMREAPQGIQGDLAMMESNLKHAHLKVTARLPTVTLNARTVAGLLPGQVIHTGHPSDIPVEVYVNEELLFLGSLGRVHGHMGFRILERASTPVPERLFHAKQGRVL
jgi:flagellar motor switch protein FliM